MNHMATCSPIVLDRGSVRAVLADAKTQLRCVMDPQPIWDGKKWDWDGVCVWMDGEDPASLLCGLFDHRAGIPKCYCPYGKPGDQLWVQESFSRSPAPVFLGGKEQPSVWYDAANNRPTWADSAPWQDPVNMGQEESRVTLELTDVRVERLQDISIADIDFEGWPSDALCLAQGLGAAMPTNPKWWRDNVARERWDEVNAERGFPWESNPWVWCLTFKRVIPDLSVQLRSED